MKKFSGLYDCTTVRTGRQTIVKPPMATNNIYVCFKNSKHKKLTHIFLYRNHMLKVACSFQSKGNLMA